MPISTADCKALLSRDSFLIAAGAKDGKGWKRLTKYKSDIGVVRIFQHTLGLYAKVVEVNGGIYIQAAAVAQDELDDAMNQRTPMVNLATPAPSTGSGTQVSWCWPRVADEASRDKAAAMLNVMYAAFIEDDETFISMQKAVRKFDPVAIANQYTFCISNYDDYLVAIITPTAYWEEEGCCYDQESPIDHLLPKHSEDLNGCGTWVIHGFEGSKLDLAKMLLAKGFHWDEKFQAFWDDVNDEPSVADLAELIRARTKP